MYLLRVGRTVGLQLHRLVAEGLVNLCDLVSVVVDIAHHVLVEMEFVGLAFYFGVDWRFVCVEASEKLA
jgi:hypothetical protein